MTSLPLLLLAMVGLTTASLSDIFGGENAINDADPGITDADTETTTGIPDGMGEIKTTKMKHHTTMADPHSPAGVGNAHTTMRNQPTRKVEYTTHPVVMPADHSSTTGTQTTTLKHNTTKGKSTIHSVVTNPGTSESSDDSDMAENKGSSEQFTTSKPASQSEKNETCGGDGVCPPDICIDTETVGGASNTTTPTCRCRAPCCAEKEGGCKSDCSCNNSDKNEKRQLPDTQCFEKYENKCDTMVPEKIATRITKSRGKRAVDGDHLVYGDAPFLLQVHATVNFHVDGDIIQKNKRCSAVMLDDTHVLTATSCVWPNASSITVYQSYAPAVNEHSEAFNWKASLKLIEPKDDKESYGDWFNDYLGLPYWSRNNVFMLELIEGERIGLNKMAGSAPACLSRPQDRFPEGTQCFSMGYGVTGIEMNGTDLVLVPRNSSSPGLVEHKIGGVDCKNQYWKKAAELARSVLSHQYFGNEHVLQVLKSLAPNVANTLEYLFGVIFRTNAGICTKPVIGIPCLEDEGGPLVCRSATDGSWRLVGVVSWPLGGCAKTDFVMSTSMVYSKNREWLDSARNNCAE